MNLCVKEFVFTFLAFLMQSKARIAGWSYSSLGTKLGQTPSTLVKQALASALHVSNFLFENMDADIYTKRYKSLFWSPATLRRYVQIPTLGREGELPSVYPDALCFLADLLCHDVPNDS